MPPEAVLDVVLASASAARARLLTDAGVVHICDPENIDEAALKRGWRGSAGALAERLAQEKARAVSLRHSGRVVIGADQVLALGDMIFDKPGDVAGVGEHLKALRGRAHTLSSAVSAARDGEILWSHTDGAVLKMRDFSDAFLADYLDRVGAEVTSSVGGYHLEGLGAQLFETVEGDHFTVLGLPLIPLLAFLRSQGVLPV